MEHESGRAGGDYVLDVQKRELEPARAAQFRFLVLGPDGTVVTDYRPLHERDLHLIVVRRDLATFSHLHPRESRTGPGRSS